MQFIKITLFFVILLGGCKKDDSTKTNNNTIYLPPLESDIWATTKPETLGWNTDGIPELLQTLEDNDTRAFLILKDGKIVIEEYFGKTIIGNKDFDKTSYWYWASAGKTLTAALTGIAMEEGFLEIHDKTSDYLGSNWTSLSSQQEEKITIFHQLTMTSGMDDAVADKHNFDPANLIFKSEAGTRWAYHNAPYTLLDKVIESATDRLFEEYFHEKLRNKIGMDGFWQWLDNDHVYFSTARSMARFGLLVLNNGNWDESKILNQNYLSNMISSSQELNLSYGYLWWLNGKNSYMVPELQIVIPGSLFPDAPSDMVSGLGKNGQYISVIPSKNMVLVRMGESPDNVPVPFLFMNDIWEVLNSIIN